MTNITEPCHSFIFFDVLPSLRSLSEDEQAAMKKDLVKRLEELSEVTVAGYSLVGFKADMHFMLHMRAGEADTIQHAVQSLLHTALGAHLRVAYTLLGLQRHTEYRSTPPKEEKPFVDGVMRYLIVYPFTKTTKWHLLPFDERKEMIKEHVITAKKHSEHITQLLLYSYGIDDHEFIVSYQTDSLHDFQTLVMDLRHTEGRRYTKNDLPIFTCTYMPLPALIESL